MILRSVLPFILFLLFVPFAVGIGEIVPEVDPDCPRPIFWNTLTGDEQWSTASNWETAEVGLPAKSPQKFNEVFLQNGTSLLDDLSLSISSLRIESQSKLVIAGSSKLLLTNVELHCWGTSWCHGHGACIDIDTCKCEDGWIGRDCSQKVCDEGVHRNPCGVCDNAQPAIVAGCTCSDFLGVDSGDVDKLLLVDTNKGLVQGIDDALVLLGQIKDTVKLYDPNTKLLEADIVDWIVYLQTFITDSINPFSDSNLQLLKQLQALTTRRNSVKLLKP